MSDAVIKHPKHALIEAAKRLREMAAIRETQSREYKFAGNELRAADMQELANELVWVAQQNEEAAKLWEQEATVEANKTA